MVPRIQRCLQIVNSQKLNLISQDSLPLTLTIGFIGLTSFWILITDQIHHHFFDDISGVTSLKALRSFFIILVNGAIGFYLLKKIHGRLISKNRDLNQALQIQRENIQSLHFQIQDDLSMIIGSLNLKKEKITDNHSINTLGESKTRILAIAKVHETLYETQQAVLVDMSSYLLSLLNAVKEPFEDRTANIETAIDIDPLILDSHVAVNLGLIASKLLISSFRYSFNRHSKGKIIFRLFRSDRSIYMLVRDDGAGIVKHKNCKSNPGVRTVIQLVRQHRWKWDYEKKEMNVFKVVIPIEIKESSFFPGNSVLNQ